MRLTMRILDLIPAFKANLTRRGREASTVATHAKNLEPFIRWIGDRPLEEVTPQDLANFLDWYEGDFCERHGRPPANNTRGNVISALCVFEWRDGRLWINVRESKTDRGRRRIPVPSELHPFLIRSGPLNQVDAPIFMTSTGKAWHRNQLYLVVHRVGEGVGVKLFPRRLRKTLGSSALNSGASLATVSRILGHSNTTITEQAYAEMLPETIASDFLRAVG
ncbi:MAG: site-specific integrase [Gaiellaceae bacterium]